MAFGQMRKPSFQNLYGFLNLLRKSFLSNEQRVFRVDGQKVLAPDKYDDLSSGIRVGVVPGGGDLKRFREGNLQRFGSKGLHSWYSLVLSLVDFAGILLQSVETS